MRLKDLFVKRNGFLWYFKVFNFLQLNFSLLWLNFIHIYSSIAGSGTNIFWCLVFWVLKANINAACLMSFRAFVNFLGFRLVKTKCIFVWHTRQILPWIIRGNLVNRPEAFNCQKTVFELFTVKYFNTTRSPT